MDLNKIASKISSRLLPFVRLRAAIDGGLPVSSIAAKDALNGVLKRFGCEGSWVSPNRFIRAFDTHSESLSGLELVIAGKIGDMVKKASDTGYNQVSDFGFTFVSNRSACRSCADSKRLVGLTMFARVEGNLKSRRGA